MRQIQSYKGSGQHYDCNIDAITHTALQGCQTLHQNQNNNNFSISIIIRRALRKYFEFLEGISGEVMRQETTEALKAAKGIK